MIIKVLGLMSEIPRLTVLSTKVGNNLRNDIVNINKKKHSTKNKKIPPTSFFDDLTDRKIVLLGLIFLVLVLLCYWVWWYLNIVGGDCLSQLPSPIEVPLSPGEPSSEDPLEKGLPEEPTAWGWAAKVGLVVGATSALYILWKIISGGGGA